jgi:UDP-N-acetylmuramate dehydrogenase
MTDFSALAHFGDRLKLNEPLTRYTVARLGGPADALITVESADMLHEVMQVAWTQGWPTRIIGGGANVLFGDRGFRGLIVVNHARAITFTEAGAVTAESGYSLIHLSRESMAHGLSGFEWAISVPGTLGGAVVNNAGAHGGEMSMCLTQATIAFPGGLQTWALDKLAYTYRESVLKRRIEPFAVLSAVLHFSPGHDPALLAAKAEEFAAHRKRTQPPGASLGSMFKNPPGDYAGRLIEAAGLKGDTAGGVMISPVHANFFVNIGGGTAQDYLNLIHTAQATVQTRFGVRLELEVETIGEF